ncbi:unnamed protein product [Adineta steineri]|uniref:Uncharacterized protein n=1 Tax=Adineta steineri TaxID=433720 RepID=A0A814RVQ8_9BILA|nr:unnamed protein product [Adineta steineri]
MVSTEGLSDINEYPVSEWGDDIYFGDDDDYEEELNLKTNGDITTRSYSSRPGTNKSTGSQLRGDSKRIRLKYSYPPVIGFVSSNVKRDPNIDYIIELHKTNIIENPYTRLAQTTLQAFRPRLMTSQTENQVQLNDTKDPVIDSTNNKTVIQFDNNKWDDGSNSDGDTEDIVSNDQSSLQIYEETCKRLNISLCSMILQSLNTTKINLENYGLGPKGSAALAAALIRNTTVLSLNLSGNNIGNTGMSYIYQILKENSYVEEYNLSYNNLGTKGIRKLAAGIASCNQLKCLNIAGNEIIASDINILLLQFEERSNIRDLNLSHNQLNEEGGISIAKWLCDDNVLLKLDLSWCSIRLMGACALAKAIGDNNRLISLDLSNNSFTNDTVEYLTNSLTRNMVLNDLNLSGNQIFCQYNTCIEENPSSLITGNNTSIYDLLVVAMTNQVLKRFRLGHNHLDTRCMIIILEALSKLDNISLEELDLTGLTLNSKQISDVEKLFTKHKQLKYYIEPIKKTIEQFVNHLLNLIHTHCDENDIDSTDLFIPYEENRVSVTYDQFLFSLRKAKIPFPIAQIENIMNYLGKDNDQGKIFLRSLQIR